MEFSKHYWAKILEIICPEMLIFGKYAFWTLFFHNILTNPVILNFSTLSEVALEAETFGDTLGDVNSQALVHTLVNSLEEVEVKIFIALNKVEAEALVDTLAYTVAEVEAKKRGGLVNVKTEALVKTLPHMIVKVEGKTF